LSGAPSRQESPAITTEVCNQDGIIKARHVDPDYRTRMEIDAVLEALRRAARS